jgi:hypothetical protein
MANKTFSVNLTDFSATINGVPVNVEVSKWDAEQAAHMIAGLVDQGLTIIIQRATAGAEDKVKAIKAKAAALSKGNYTFGQGGGASLSPETRGWIDWLGPRVTIPKGKTLSGKNWQDYAKVVMQRDLLSSEQATKETVVKLVDDNFEKWVKFMEENDEAVLIPFRSGLWFQLLDAGALLFSKGCRGVWRKIRQAES